MWLLRTRSCIWLNAAMTTVTKSLSRLVTMTLAMSPNGIIITMMIVLSLAIVIMMMIMSPVAVAATVMTMRMSFLVAVTTLRTAILTTMREKMDVTVAAVVAAAVVYSMLSAKPHVHFVRPTGVVEVVVAVDAAVKVVAAIAVAVLEVVIEVDVNATTGPADITIIHPRDTEKALSMVQHLTTVVLLSIHHLAMVSLGHTISHLRLSVTIMGLLNSKKVPVPWMLQGDPLQDSLKLVTRTTGTALSLLTLSLIHLSRINHKIPLRLKPNSKVNSKASSHIRANIRTNRRRTSSLFRRMMLAIGLVLFPKMVLASNNNIKETFRWGCLARMLCAAQVTRTVDHPRGTAISTKTTTIHPIELSKTPTRGLVTPTSTMTLWTTLRTTRMKTMYLSVRVCVLRPSLRESRRPQIRRRLRRLLKKSRILMSNLIPRKMMRNLMMYQSIQLITMTFTLMSLCNARINPFIRNTI